VIDQMEDDVDENSEAGRQPELAHRQWIAAVAGKSSESGYEPHSSGERRENRRAAERYTLTP